MARGDPRARPAVPEVPEEGDEEAVGIVGDRAVERHRFPLQRVRRHRDELGSGGQRGEDPGISVPADPAPVHGHGGVTETVRTGTKVLARPVTAIDARIAVPPVPAVRISVVPVVGIRVEALLAREESVVMHPAGPVIQVEAVLAVRGDVVPGDVHGPREIHREPRVRIPDERVVRKEPAGRRAEIDPDAIPDRLIPRDGRPRGPGNPESVRGGRDAVVRDRRVRDAVQVDPASRASGHRVVFDPRAQGVEDREAAPPIRLKGGSGHGDAVRPGDVDSVVVRVRGHVVDPGVRHLLQDDAVVGRAAGVHTGIPDLEGGRGEADRDRVRGGRADVPTRDDVRVAG